VEGNFRPFFISSFFTERFNRLWKSPLSGLPPCAFDKDQTKGMGTSPFSLLLSKVVK
jgi:hypothetical protein